MAYKVLKSKTGNLKNINGKIVKDRDVAVVDAADFVINLMNRGPKVTAQVIDMEDGSSVFRTWRTRGGGIGTDSLAGVQASAFKWRQRNGREEKML